MWITDRQLAALALAGVVIAGATGWSVASDAASPAPTVGPSEPAAPSFVAQSLAPALQERADRAVATSAVVKAMLGSRATLVLKKEGPWTDERGVALGIARIYGLTSPVDTPKVQLPVVRFVQGRSGFSKGQLGMRVTGLREISVLITSDGTIADIFPTDRSAVTEVDTSGVDLAGKTSGESR